MVPDDDALRTLLLSENHDPGYAGHFRAEKTQAMVERYWRWKGLARDVRVYVRSCDKCQRHKHQVIPLAGYLHPIVAQRPWHILTVDFVGGLPPAAGSGNVQILVLVDKFSKYVCLEPCAAEVSAIQTAAILQRRVIRDFGVPRVVISDRGPQFSAAVWTHLLQSWGASVALASTHHPQTDGQSERAIQTLLRLIRNYARHLPDQWESMLPMFQFAMNNAPSAAGKYSPFQVLFGLSPMTPADLLVDDPELYHPAWDTNDTDLSGWVRRWWKTRRRLRQFVRANLHRTADMVKRRYDKRHPCADFYVDDLVMVSAKSHPHGDEVRKLRPKFYGPYPIVGKVNDNAFQLGGLPPAMPKTQNISFLRLFVPSSERFSNRPAEPPPVPVTIDGHRE